MADRTYRIGNREVTFDDLGGVDIIGNFDGYLYLDAEDLKEILGRWLLHQNDLENND